jgi:uncharacterized cofD-like protein
MARPTSPPARTASSSSCSNRRRRTAPRHARSHRQRRPHHPRPGSLYTSLITNLLVRGIPEAIAASKATRVYVGNLMTQANESLGLTASQHIEKIMQHCGGRKTPIFDYALINTAPISPALLERYAREGQQPIEPDLDRIRALGVEPIVGNFVHEGDVLRHDPDRVTAPAPRFLHRAHATPQQSSPPR